MKHPNTNLKIIFDYWSKFVIQLTTRINRTKFFKSFTYCLHENLLNRRTIPKTFYNLLINRKRGKIHTIYNWNVFALLGDRWYPSIFFARGGSLRYDKSSNWCIRWVGNSDVINSKVKDCLSSFDANINLSRRNKGACSYQFDDFGVRYYQKNHI